MTPENFRFYDKFNMLDNTYHDDSDFHFTFLVGECECNGKIENIWADMSGYISNDGSVNVYFDDDFKGYILDSGRNETLVELPEEMLDKLSELTEQAIRKSRNEQQKEYEK